jgi:hypothetical protein
MIARAFGPGRSVLISGFFGAIAVAIIFLLLVVKGEHRHFAKCRIRDELRMMID